MTTEWRVYCDFDGTVSEFDVTDQLLEAFALPAWRTIEADWRAGRIGSLECMQRQVALLRCERSQLDTLLQSAAIDPHFPQFVRYCREHAVPLAILSDGIDYAIHAVLRHYGLDGVPVWANRLASAERGHYRLEFPHRCDTCESKSGTCKCRIMKEPDGAGSQSLLIGDGASDFCAATAADLVFAKDELLTHCRERGIPHEAFGDFGDVIRLLDGLREPAAMSV
jgi:2-hydroxy-3-keto-5-methylthiopentenyl-1-phosphate phosphatase